MDSRIEGSVFIVLSFSYAFYYIFVLVCLQHFTVGLQGTSFYGDFRRDERNGFLLGSFVLFLYRHRC